MLQIIRMWETQRVLGLKCLFTMVHQAARVCVYVCVCTCVCMCHWVFCPFRSPNSMIKDWFVSRSYGYCLAMLKTFIILNFYNLVLIVHTYKPHCEILSPQLHPLTWSWQKEVTHPDLPLKSTRKAFTNMTLYFAFHLALLLTIFCL